MATKTARLRSPTGTVKNQLNDLKSLLHWRFTPKKLFAHWHLDPQKIPRELPGVTNRQSRVVSWRFETTINEGKAGFQAGEVSRSTSMKVFCRIFATGFIFWQLSFYLFAWRESLVRKTIWKVIPVYILVWCCAYVLNILFSGIAAF